MENAIGKIIRQSFVPTESTIYYYPLNGDLGDYSLNQLPDAVNNGCEFVVDSMVGKMIKFDSSGKYLTLPPRTTYLSDLLDRTISYILLIKDVYSEQQTVFNIGTNSGYGKSCQITFNQIVVSSDDLAPLKPCIMVSVRGTHSLYSTQLECNSWTPVLITHTIANQANRLRTYVNGKVVNHVYINARGTSLTNTDIYLGKGIAETNTNSNLILAEFILEGRVWTELEVANYSRSIGF